MVRSKDIEASPSTGRGSLVNEADHEKKGERNYEWPEVVKYGGKVEWHVNWRVSRGGQLVAGRWRMESIGGAFSSASTYDPTSYHASLAFLDFFPTFSPPAPPHFSPYFHSLFHLYSSPTLTSSLPNFSLSFPPSPLPPSSRLFPFLEKTTSPPLLSSPFLSSPSHRLLSRSTPLFVTTAKRVDPYAILSRKRTCKPHGPTFRSTYSSTYIERPSSNGVTAILQLESPSPPPSSQLDLVSPLYFRCTMSE